MEEKIKQLKHEILTNDDEKDKFIESIFDHLMEWKKSELVELIVERIINNPETDEFDTFIESYHEMKQFLNE